jgi:hypothetical protein
VVWTSWKFPDIPMPLSAHMVTLKQPRINDPAVSWQQNNSRTMT